MIKVLIWFLFTFVTYSIAKSKNRNEVVWAILGVLFGIFALIVVALLPKLEVDDTNTEIKINKKDNE